MTDPRIPLIKLQRTLCYELRRALFLGTPAEVAAIRFDLQECRRDLQALVADRATCPA